MNIPTCLEDEIMGLEVAVRSRIEFFDAHISYALTQARYRKIYSNPYSERRQYEFLRIC